MHDSLLSADWVGILSDVLVAGVGADGVGVGALSLYVEQLVIIILGSLPPVMCRVHGVYGVACACNFTHSYKSNL